MVYKRSLQLLSTVDYNFFKYNPSNFNREATPATPVMIRAAKVMTYDVKALHMAFLGRIGTIFWAFLKNPKKLYF